MRYIDKDEVASALDYESLIERLRKAFQSHFTVPKRHHHDYKNPAEGNESTLLLMPAWEEGKDLGVKIVTVSPNNGKYNLPSIQGIYLLLDAHKGIPIALLEAKTLTTKRTAAASALASDYLSRKDSKTLLMVGTGALAPELIRAHTCVRPIKKVMIWGRSFEKAEALADSMSNEGISSMAVKELEETVGQADIISCATISKEPLILGKWLRNGQHLDLVGAYRPDMREADDEAITKSKVFVDTHGGAPREGGDIFIPLSEGVISQDDILADLFELSKGGKKGRTSESEITFFKSVGHALEDLAAAQLVKEKILQSITN
ncbi:ornithine cyclodeaminase family protein [Fulvivirgaceae bacterium BMA10]|uniref:Ornithine cyclodeaminase family protein n=1 Tax=Splendidivirga corallicola TaxID=3051826 RepID=A0ABT8KH93_9BACT|nr:ornithine cyclodeaminase family protein [Fulvivirgaceae bacterium BMA10]